MRTASARTLAVVAAGGNGSITTVEFESAAHWEQWLEAHHDSPEGVWLTLAKTGHGPGGLTHPEALDVALCFGWIDGQRRSRDERSWQVRFTPRRARSVWSQVNRRRATELAEAGRMRPTGLAEIERAKQDGRWERAYAPSSSATVPPDLAAALDASPAAKAFFATLDSHNRFSVLHRIGQAKKPETRTRRIEKFVAMLAAGEKLHP
jgi:uncharacterized protein YdeI (YjbR/CyaY-like superfamily)